MESSLLVPKAFGLQRKQVPLKNTMSLYAAIFCSSGPSHDGMMERRNVHKIIVTSDVTMIYHFLKTARKCTLGREAPAGQHQLPTLSAFYAQS